MRLKKWRERQMRFFFSWYVWPFLPCRLILPSYFLGCVGENSKISYKKMEANPFFCERTFLENTVIIPLENTIPFRIIRLVVEYALDTVISFNSESDCCPRIVPICGGIGQTSVSSFLRIEYVLLLAAEVHCE